MTGDDDFHSSFVESVNDSIVAEIRVNWKQIKTFVNICLPNNTKTLVSLPSNTKNTSLLSNTINISLPSNTNIISIHLLTLVYKYIRRRLMGSHWGLDKLITLTETIFEWLTASRPNEPWIS